MERSVALAKLRKILGKNLGYRVSAKAPTVEEREAAQVQLPAARAERDQLKDQRRARCNAILAGDQEYQALVAAHKAAEERVGKLFSDARHYKITVGICNDMFFHQKAEGDSWEEVLEKLAKPK
jgi:hypothetical protein